MSPRVLGALSIALALVGCASDPPPPAPPARSQPVVSPQRAASPAPAETDGVVIRGSKKASDAPVTDKSADEQARIARLEASARDSQGKKQGGTPVKYVAPKGTKVIYSSEWTDSLETARDRSRNEKRLVLALFTGSDWCPWCQKLKAEVFDTSDFKDWASQNAVLLEVDFPEKKAQSDDLKAQNRGLRDKFAVTGYPRIVFFDPSGKVYGQLQYAEGGPSVWLPAAQKIVDAYKP